MSRGRGENRADKVLKLLYPEFPVVVGVRLHLSSQFTSKGTKASEEEEEETVTLGRERKRKSIDLSRKRRKKRKHHLHRQHSVIQKKTKNQSRRPMGRLYLVELERAASNGNIKIYTCKHCHAHLSLSDQIVSKSFHCKHGKAYLFNKVVNVTVGVKEERLMITGMHTVADIFCVRCGSIVGWKYLAACDKNQKYKEGKFILERLKIAVPDGTNYWVSHEAQIAGSDADEA